MADFILRRGNIAMPVRPDTLPTGATRMFDELDREVFATGELIFRVGDAGECAYVIEEGSVEVYIDQSGAEQLLVPCPACSFGLRAKYNKNP